MSNGPSTRHSRRQWVSFSPPACPSATSHTPSHHHYLRRAARARVPTFEPADEQGRRRGRSPPLGGRRVGRAWRKMESQRKVRKTRVLRHNRSLLTNGWGGPCLSRRYALVSFLPRGEIVD